MPELSRVVPHFNADHWMRNVASIGNGLMVRIWEALRLCGPPHQIFFQKPAAAVFPGAPATQQHPGFVPNKAKTQRPPKPPTKPAAIDGMAAENHARPTGRVRGVI
ncbi:hypothetical protein ABZP36_016423 [Zizania latifolia]